MKRILKFLLFLGFLIIVFVFGIHQGPKFCSQSQFEIPNNKPVQIFFSGITSYFSDYIKNTFASESGCEESQDASRRYDHRRLAPRGGRAPCRRKLQKTITRYLSEGNEFRITHSHFTTNYVLLTTN